MKAQMVSTKPIRINLEASILFNTEILEKNKQLKHWKLNDLFTIFIFHFLKTKKKYNIILVITTAELIEWIECTITKWRKFSWMLVYNTFRHFN